MQDEQMIIDALGIANWSEEQRRPVIDEATLRIGSAVSSTLSEQQRNEYTAILDDDYAVINAWLDQNVPDYKNNPLYQEIAQSYETDPEQNNPSKLFATLAWLQMNVPNMQELLDTTLATYKQELSQTA